MARLRPQLAKLTPPRLYHAVARDRLFAAIDDARARPVVWIAGPPGAGKTTLIATYARSQNLRPIWFQLDRGDADPATFFYFLQHAAFRALSPHVPPLPLLTPEYQPDLPGFARRWFRRLFAEVSADTLLVFDNYQELSADSPLHAAIAQALEEIPHGSNVIVASRSDPPPQFARLLASESIGWLGWEDLRLDLAETTAIARVRIQGNARTMQTLFEISGGWAAGVTLMLEQVRRDGVLRETSGRGSRELVFDYFAHHVFDAEPQEVQDLLLRTSVLSDITEPLAVGLTRNGNAVRLLESLHRRRLFIDRRGNTETSYQYHALFQQYLRKLAAERYTSEEFVVLLKLAANLLTDSGRPEDAFHLYVQVEDWSRATELLVGQAPQLIGQGRLQTVLEWAEQVPGPQREGDPWIGYWTAMALQPIHPDQAHNRLVAVFESFRVRGNATGQMISAAGILDTLFTEFADFGQMDSWIDILASFLNEDPEFPTPEAEFRTYLSLVAAVYRAPGHPMLARSARQVEILLKQPFDANLKVVAAQRLGAYADAATDLELWDRVAADVTPLLDAPNVTPANVTRYLEMAAYHHYLAWRVDEALLCYEQARRIAQREGLHTAALRAGVYAVLCLRRAGRLAAAEHALAEIESIPKPNRGATLAVFQHTQALMAYTRGDLPEALDLERAALATVLQSGNRHSEVVLRAFHSSFLIAAGDLAAANHHLARAKNLAKGTAIDAARAYIAMHEAHAAHLAGDHAMRNARLEEALQFARYRGGVARLRWAPEAMATLLPIAWEQGIEPDLAASLIKEFAILPPSPTMEHWPWPVKIRTLGAFSVLVNGAPIAFGRKVPRKLLALLQAIVALGGKDVPEQRLVDAIWPDEEGDAGHRLLRVALHRLRKLLGERDAIHQSARSLTLDPTRCWVDAWAFEALLERPGPSAADSHTALELYRGNFLEGVEDAPWTIGIRDRLRNRFVQTITARGFALESQGSFDEAIGAYQRGLDVDATVEQFYQGLMRCHGSLGRHSEAVGDYHRLRQTLSRIRGVPPSTQSERLYESVSRVTHHLEKETEK